MEILDGVRVLDVSRFIAGPYCCWLLAALGAEVIRMENPRGEFDRITGLPTQTGENVMFLTLASGKKSVTLDFTKGDKAKQLFAKLVKRSDVVVENMGPGVPEEWGLTYEELCRIKPDIILVHSTAYGSSGPYKDRIGFDSIGQAMSGAISITGFEETPLAARIPYVDFVTATNSAMAVVTALYYREKTGKGQNIEVSLLRSACTLSSLVVSEYVTTKRERQPRRIGNRGYWSAYSNVCKTRDGRWVMIAVPAPMIRRLFRAMGKEELANNLRLASDIDIFDKRHITDPLIERWIASKTMDELEEIALRFRIPLGPVLDYTEVLDHPQVQAEKLFTEATLSDGSFKMPVPAFPIRFSELAFKDNVVIPKLGEHNQEIWGKLCDLNAQELAKLKEEEII